MFEHLINRLHKILIMDSGPTYHFTDHSSDASAVVYYFCHRMSLHVCPDESFILDSRLANFGKETVLLAFCM